MINPFKFSMSNDITYESASYLIRKIFSSNFSFLTIFLVRVEELI